MICVMYFEVKVHGSKVRKQQLLGWFCFSITDPCMVHLPTLTIKEQQLNVGKYTIHGSYGIGWLVVVF